MNSYQAAKQIQYLLRAALWQDDSTQVFPDGGVLVSVAPVLQALPLIPMPAAIIAPLTMQPDPGFGEEPQFITRRFAVRLYQVVAGDHIGENALLGANQSGLYASEGRGLLELEERLFNAIDLITSSGGLSIQFVAGDAANAQFDEEAGYLAWCEYVFEAILTRSAFYHPSPGALTATGGVGQVDLSWEAAPDRFDRYSYVLRRASGSTPPSGPGEGVGVTLASLLDLSVSDTGLGAGTYSYSLFVGYDDWGRSQALNYSAAITATATVT